MEREIHSEKTHPRKKGAILLDVHRDGKTVEPHILTTPADDEISVFFSEEIDKIGSSIRGARKRLAFGRRKGRHDRMSLRQRKAIKGSIKENENKLSILIGREVRPVLITRNKEGSITGWQPSFELDHKSRVWWKLTLGEVPGMFESIQNEDNLEIVKEAFDLRYCMKFGSDEQRAAAEKDYFNGYFSKKIGELPDDVIAQISPILNGIGNKV